LLFRGSAKCSHLVASVDLSLRLTARSILPVHPATPSEPIELSRNIFLLSKQFKKI